MNILSIQLKNWRNFKELDVPLRQRMFIIGPNASGKSNFLDALRFLRDISKDGGGLQKAVKDRGGIQRLRSLYARKNPKVELTVSLGTVDDQLPTWKYSIGIEEDSRTHSPRVAFEKVWHKTREILSRPTEDDEKDSRRLTQTHLEQINSNQEFRQVYEFLRSVLYLHLVPQLLRHPEMFVVKESPEDPFGRNFLERLSSTNKKTRDSRLNRIGMALRVAVPQFKGLSFVIDDKGIPHLEAVYAHWRPSGVKQREDQFSDGTLRLVGLLWAMLEEESTLLLEEPELSLNTEIVRRLAGIMFRLQPRSQRQFIVTTHSPELLSDSGIDGREVLLLRPTNEGTDAKVASNIREIRQLLESGLSVAEVVLPHSNPADPYQLEFAFSNAEH